MKLNEIINSPYFTDKTVIFHEATCFRRNPVTLTITEDGKFKHFSAEKWQDGLDPEINMDDIGSNNWELAKYPGAVEFSETTADRLDAKDHIFDELRKKYSAFDMWFRKCQIEMRTCLLIEDDKNIVGIAILKNESNIIENRPIGIMKSCAYDVSLHGRGVGTELMKHVNYREPEEFAASWFVAPPSARQLPTLWTAVPAATFIVN